jgi:alkanesulfonate monooxygenase SsuD/methylene tetrahydromethanopterin reductase-like flavin-dependent oxidoreductase (luciferase family)
MQHGVVFPQTEFGNDIQAIKDYAQTAEALGYDYLLVYDHVLGAHPTREPKLTGPYTYEHPFHEPMVFFGFLAAITTRLELVTGILILPQRQTALVAKQTAEVDVLSGGRLRLGIGIGWNYVEYDALGEKFQTRGRRAEEQIEVLRKLWTQPLVTHKTTHHVIDNATSIHCLCNAPSPSGSGVLLNPRSSALHGSVTGGCRLVGHRMTRSKPILSSSMAILRKLAAIAKILVLIRGSAFRA